MLVNLETKQITKDTYERDSDALLQNLKSKTPQEAANWVEANVIDLASAKDVIKSMAKVTTRAPYRLYNKNRRLMNIHPRINTGMFKIKYQIPGVNNCV